MRIGIAPDEDSARQIRGVPFVAIVAPPADAPTLSGETIRATAMNLLARVILSGHSIDQPSKIIETSIPRRGDVALAGMELWGTGGTRALALLPGPTRALGAGEGVSSAPTSAESGALETQSEKQTGNRRKR